MHAAATVVGHLAAHRGGLGNQSPSGQSGDLASFDGDLPHRAHRHQLTHCAPMPLANPATPALVAACGSVLVSSGPIEVAEEHGYASLPLCVIDSVFSIGVRYEGVRNLIDRYCRRFGLPKQGPKGTVPARDQQESINGFQVRVIAIDADRLATEVFGNRQRTSARSGILEADGVVQSAAALSRHRTGHLPDGLESRDRSAVEANPGMHAVTSTWCHVRSPWSGSASLPSRRNSPRFRRVG